MWLGDGSAQFSPLLIFLAAPPSSFICVVSSLIIPPFPDFYQPCWPDFLASGRVSDPGLSHCPSHRDWCRDGEVSFGTFVGNSGRGSIFLGAAKLIKVYLKVLCPCLGRLFPRVKPTQGSRAKRQRKQILNNLDWVPGHSHAWNTETISIPGQFTYVSQLIFSPLLLKPVWLECLYFAK